MRLRNFVFVVGFVLVGAFAASGQDGVRGIARKDHYSNLPYEIVNWMVDGKAVADVSHFTAGPDWWQHVAISAKNVSGKTITAESFDLFIDPKANMTMMADMKLEPEGFTGPGRIKWEPGRTMIFRIDDAQAAMWGKHVKSLDVADIDHLTFQATYFYFDDGSNWKLGEVRASEAGQSADLSKKLIRLGNWFPDAPVHVTAMQANGRPVNAGESFTGGDDWLNGPVITFRNDSSQPITCVRFSLRVLDSHPTAPSYSFPVWFGSLDGKTGQCNGPSSIAPGATGDATFLPGAYERMITLLASREPLSTRTTAEVWLYEVYFADGRKWFGGVMQRPDPEHPGQWITEPKPAARQ